MLKSCFDFCLELFSEIFGVQENFSAENLVDFAFFFLKNRKELGTV